MSYDIIITCASISRDDAEAWREIEKVLDRHGPVVPRMDAFYKDLATLYPSGDTLPEEEWETTSPWATGPLLSEFDGDWAFLPLRRSTVDRAVPAIIDVAHRHGLTVFDDNGAHQIHRSDGYRGFKLDVEGRPYLISPREDQIRDAVMALSPDGDGAFLILTAPDGDYAQVAGGLGEYVFERRDYAQGAFHHWAAGRGEPAAEMHRVRTCGAYVEVRASEVLSAEDTCRLLLEFAWDWDLSPDYRWRDLTAEFLQTWDA